METDVLHTGDQAPLAVAAVVVARESRRIVGSVVSVRSAKLSSAFLVEPESPCLRPWQTDMPQGCTVDDLKPESHRRHCLRRCSSGGCTRGLVGIVCAGGRIAGGYKLAGSLMLRSTGIGKTWRRFAKTRDWETCATWHLMECANIWSPCRRQTHPAGRCSCFVPHTVRFLRPLVHSGLGPS
jgi:hypothetical protein